MGVADTGPHVVEASGSVVDSNTDVANYTLAVPHHADGTDRGKVLAKAMWNLPGIVEGQLNPLTRRP